MSSQVKNVNVTFSWTYRKSKAEFSALRNSLIHNSFLSEICLIAQTLTESSSWKYQASLTQGCVNLTHIKIKVLWLWVNQEQYTGLWASFLV